MADSASAALPLLLTVTFCAALVAPMAVGARVSAAGVTLATGAAAEPDPVPVSVIATGVRLLLLMMLSVPVRAPLAVGVKVTSTVQFKPVPTVAAQVPPERAKSPVVLMFKPLSELPDFRLALTVTVCAAAVVPTGVAVKVTLAGVLPR